MQLEVNTLFQSLTNTLQKVDPINLNATLSALGEGLRGNGDDLGATLAGLNYYLQQFNPKLPALQQVFQKTGVVGNIYADAAPDLVTVFDNAPTISKTVVDQQDNLNATLLAATGSGEQRHGHPATGSRRLHRRDPAAARAVEGGRRLLAGVRLRAQGLGQGASTRSRPSSAASAPASSWRRTSCPAPPPTRTRRACRW